MSSKSFASAPRAISTMPPGIPYIVGNEAAERFSFYGMRTILMIFMVKYLWLMGDQPGIQMSDANAKAQFHFFTAFVYFTPFFGALLADAFFGKYRVIVYLSLVYCLGHAALAFMGSAGSTETWFLAGLWLIIVGSGGIKPCVSAHVGDQFGAKNSHLLPKIFNWFYWSINLGAFLSTLLTPWLLEWYGPHWAFGVPGILMALATLIFWMGRWKFVHMPAKGMSFIREVFSGAGFKALLKLSTIYVFIAIFWALFDQQSSSWVLQAEDMNRRWMGVDWLPSQIQMMNPILILIFIPLFSYVIYPAVDRFFKLTPLRKMAIGFFLMTAAFLIVTIAQERIDSGQTPSISWQIMAFVLMTAAEVMISIVGLEFSYTQAPKTMKSFVMALFLLAVFGGNLLVGIVNKVIQVPTPIVAEVGEQIFAGADGKEGTADDIRATFDTENKLTALDFSGRPELEQLVSQVVNKVEANNNEVFPNAEGTELVNQQDPFGNVYRYTQINRNQVIITSAGPDGKFMTEWDQGATINISRAAPESKENWWTELIGKFRPEKRWLDSRKEELGIATDEEMAEGSNPVSVDYFVGGQIRLQGASYFWFFTWLMLGASVLFMLVAKFYKPRDYLLKEE